LPVRSDEPYGKRRRHPIYAAAARARLPVALHAWGRPTAARSPNAHVTTYLEDYAANTIIVQSQLTSLVSEGVFELFPELRIVLTECGFSWLPPLLWRLDKNWKSLWREVPWLTRRPSEYVEKHFYMTIAPTHLPLDPALLREQLDLVGTCRLLYASDFPHDHGPGASELLSVLREPEATAVLSSTARELYGLDVLTRP
jgi:predicted TIM-barrel fold metal-dependent hydrolase